MNDFREVREAIAAKTRELLGVHVDHNGRRIDAEPATSADPAPHEQPTGPRAPAADPTQGTRNAGMPGEITNARLIAAERVRFIAAQARLGRPERPHQ